MDPLQTEEVVTQVAVKWGRGGCWKKKDKEEKRGEPCRTRKKWRGKEEKEKNRNKVGRDRRRKRKKKKRKSGRWLLGAQISSSLWSPGSRPAPQCSQLRAWLAWLTWASACLFLAEINHFLVLFLVQITAGVHSRFFASCQQECKQGWISSWQVLYSALPSCSPIPWESGLYRSRCGAAGEGGLTSHNTD